MNHSEIDWNYLNNLIYRMNRIDDRDQMREFFMQMLDLAIPCQCAVFCLAGEDDCFAEPLIRGGRVITADSVKRDLRQSIAALRWVFDSGLNRVFRLSEYYQKKETVFCGDFLKECRNRDLRYFTLVVLSHEYRYEGCLLLMRDYESGDFSDVDIRLLDLVKDHLALRLADERRLRRKQRRQWRELRKNTVCAIKERFALTKREAEVLELIFRGEQNSAICSRLSIAESTLKKHILGIYEKTDGRNRTDLIRLFNDMVDDGEKTEKGEE